MSIVSVSVDEKTMNEMQRIQSLLELAGRSELVRTSIKTLASDLAEKEKMTGTVSCVLTVTHEERQEEKVTRIKHKFEDIIKTHLHCKLKNEKCLEIFVLEGKADSVREMARQFQRNEKMDNVKLIMA